MSSQVSDSSDPNTPTTSPLRPVPAKRSEIATRIAQDLPLSEDIAFQHSVFCQTSLPYRDPGAIREWERKQGKTHLLIKAGEVLHPESKKFVKLGLPFGPKPRLILTYLNTQAIKTQSPEIPVDDSLSAFVRTLGLQRNGYTLRQMKEHLSRLSACMITLASEQPDQEGSIPTHYVKLVTTVSLWPANNPAQRTLWPNRVTLGQEYYDNLTRYAVPLDMRAVHALQNNAFALDMYAWLAQRLWRISLKEPQWISWVALMDQFGQGYRRIDNFKRDFRATLMMVLSQYPKAKITEDLNKGFLLYSSPPPIPPRNITPVKWSGPKAISQELGMDEE